MRTEVHRELHRIAAQTMAGRPYAVRPDLRKQLDFGLAKHIDGLHRVADQENRAAFARIPCRKQRRDQLMLAARGVLKFIDEKMAHVAGDVQHALRGMREHIDCGERKLGEVDAILLRENNFQLRYRLAQNGENVAQRGPLRFRVAAGR